MIFRLIASTAFFDTVKNRIIQKGDAVSTESIDRVNKLISARVAYLDYITYKDTKIEDEVVANEIGDKIKFTTKKIKRKSNSVKKALAEKNELHLNVNPFMKEGKVIKGRLADEKTIEQKDEIDKKIERAENKYLKKLKSIADGKTL